MRSIIAAPAVVLAACGAKQPTDDELGFEPMATIEMPGSCVTTRTPSTVASLFDPTSSEVLVCRAGASESGCHKIELATGAMVEASPQIQSATYDQPAAVIDNGQLVVCWGQTVACQRKDPDPGATWLGAEIGDTQIAALSGSPAGKKVSVFDRELTSATTFDVAPGAASVHWLGGVLYVVAKDGAATRGAIYGADGSSKGEVGGDRPFDVGERAPVAVGKSRYAWLAADSASVAVHDVVASTRVRIDLEDVATTIGADIAATPDGRVIVALGGDRFGDIVIVDPGRGNVKNHRAKVCP
jgi:hypothetical protein